MAGIPISDTKLYRIDLCKTLHQLSGISVYSLVLYPLIYTVSTLRKRTCFFQILFNTQYTTSWTVLLVTVTGKGRGTTKLLIELTTSSPSEMPLYLSKM